MEDLGHLVTPCTTNTMESNNFIDQPIFKVENITIARPTLLKIFYWESLDIENFNEKLLSQSAHIEHHLKLPTRHLNSPPLKIIFWLRNISNFECGISCRRIQNCQCIPRQTRVGFNQFRNLYHCPHRQLINIPQEKFVMQPHNLLPMPVETNYYILGNYMLSFELKISNTCIIVLHFHINITTFNAVENVLTHRMIPVNIKEHRFMSQPLWIQNISMHNKKFLFTGKNRDFHFINPTMIIPPHSVWPLIVQYRPNDFENKLDLFVTYGEKASMKCNPNDRFKISITCNGYIEEENENYSVPILDYEYSDNPYITYPNRLQFIMELNEERTLMVAVHNYSQNCMEFKWQTYALKKYFTFTFEPQKFTLKPRHIKLCVVRAKSFKNPLHFTRIPAVLEVHRILDTSTQIAKQLLKEIESIDDPKWADSSFVEYVLLHLDLKVQFSKLQRIDVKQLANELYVSPERIDTMKINKNCITIFEKLFWEYLSKSNYMRNKQKIPTNLTYKQVLNQEIANKEKNNHGFMNKQEAFNLLSFLTAEACRDLSKNYRFVPPEILDIN